MKEIWRLHPKFVDYEVSTRGRIRRATPAKGTIVGRLKEPSLGTTGYLVVNIEGKPRKVHSMVIETFVGPRPAGSDACHRNGRRTDNRIENLYWGSRTQNMRDARAHGTDPRCDRHGGSKLTWPQVLQIRSRHAAGELQRDLAAEFDVTRGHVSYLINHGWQP